MNLNTKQFLDALKTVSPALIQNEMYPLRSCFGFTGEQVIGYNGEIAIIKNFETDFNGSVIGNTLLEWSKSFSIEENGSDRQLFTERQTESSVKFRIEKSEIELPINPKIEFTLPAIEDVEEIHLTDDFVKDLEKCRISMNENIQSGWMYGITMFYKDDKYCFFSTDDGTASRSLNGEMNVSNRKLQLPFPFVKLLIQFDKIAPATNIKINKQWIKVDFDGGLQLLAHRLNSEPSTQYFNAFGLADSEFDRLAIIPDGFESALQRCSIVEKLVTTISCKNNKLRLTAKGDYGKVEEEFDFQHPDFESNYVSKQLLKMVKGNTAIGFSNQFCQVRNESYTGLITSVSRK
jgi:hypothetical protein